MSFVDAGCSEPAYRSPGWSEQRLLPQPGGFEGVSAMAEVLDLAQLPMSDREELHEVDHDRDAALPATATLADGHQDAIVRHLDELEWLVGQVVPGAPVLLRELDELRDAPKVLRGVGVGPLVMPMHLHLRIEKFRQGFAGQLISHERVNRAAEPPHQLLHLLLRHRLLRQRGGLEGFGAILVLLVPDDSLILDRPHGSAGVLDPGVASLEPASLADHRDDAIRACVDE